MQPLDYIGANKKSTAVHKSKNAGSVQHQYLLLEHAAFIIAFLFLPLSYFIPICQMFLSTVYINCSCISVWVVESLQATIKMKEKEVNLKEVFLLRTLLPFFCTQTVLDNNITRQRDTLAMKRDGKVSKNSRCFYQPQFLILKAESGRGVGARVDTHCHCWKDQNLLLWNKPSASQ